MNDNRAASVRANMECDFEASLYRENKILYFTYACRQNIYVRSTDSERESASSACYIHLNHARKSVENGVFFLLFAYFFFFYRNKEEKVREFFEIKSFLKCPFLSL